jgi:hypothetical protein
MPRSDGCRRGGSFDVAYCVRVFLKIALPKRTEKGLVKRILGNAKKFLQYKKRAYLLHHCMYPSRNQKCEPQSFCRQTDGWSVTVPSSWRVSLQQGPFIGQKIHLQNPLATARAEHRRLFNKTVVSDYVKRAAVQPLRQRLLGHFRAIRRHHPSVQPIHHSPEKAAHPIQAIRLSANSTRPSNGVASPTPALSASNAQRPSSTSVISSMLARLKITLA